MSKKVEKQKGFLNQQQFQAVFGVEPGQVQRWIKFGLPVKGSGSGKQFNLVEAGQWVVSHLKAGYLSLEQTAEMFGQEVRTITKWKNEHGLPQAMPGFYKRDDVVKWREKYLSKKLKEAQSGGADGMSQSTRLKRVQSQRQELRLQKEAGQLVEIEKVIPIVQKMFLLIAQKRKNFSKNTNPQLDGVVNDGEREEILNRNVNDLFNNIVESGIRELNRLRELSGQNEHVAQYPEAPAKAAIKRTRRGHKNSKRGKRKRAGTV